VGYVGLKRKRFLSEKAEPFGKFKARKRKTGEVDV
jgi:hypothetical protein